VCFLYKEKLGNARNYKGTAMHRRILITAQTTKTYRYQLFLAMNIFNEDMAYHRPREECNSY
jgi:hypothetical protein